MKNKDFKVGRFYLGWKNKKKLKQVVGVVIDPETKEGWLYIQNWYGEAAPTLVSVQKFMRWTKRVVPEKEAKRMLGKILKP